MINNVIKLYYPKLIYLSLLFSFSNINYEIIVDLERQYSCFYNLHFKNDKPME